MSDSLPLVQHWINGAISESASGRTAPVFDPALGQQTKSVVLADQAEIDATVAAAQAAFPGWSSTSNAKRQQVVFAFR
ncbi:aldehyde dehydrogenase family protein, partial [Schumannella luteola]